VHTHPRSDWRNGALWPTALQREIKGVVSELFALKERALKAQAAAGLLQAATLRLSATAEVLATQAAGMPLEFQEAAEKACGQGTEYFESTVRALDWLGDVLSKEARLDTAIVQRTSHAQKPQPAAVRPGKGGRAD
jgi:hypothetical protein